MSEQATEPGVDERGDLRKSLERGAGPWSRSAMSIAVEAGIVEGRDWEDALDSLPWEDGEVLVVGSSRLGPVARVFLGSNQTKIIRSSPVPVVVIPRGAEVRLQNSAPAARGFEREQ